MLLGEFPSFTKLTTQLPNGYYSKLQLSTMTTDLRVNDRMGYQARVLVAVGVFIITAMASLFGDDTTTTNKNVLESYLLQPRLGGEFGGMRGKWETNNGIAWSGTYTTDVLGNTTGGAATGTTYAEALSLSLAADLQKAMSWDGGSFKTTWVWLSGRDLSSDVIKNAMTVSSISGNTGILCSELWLEQKLPENFSLRGGLLYAASEFMTADTASWLLNSTFSTPALFSQNVVNGNVVTATWPAPGVRLAWQPAPWLIARSAFAQVNPFNEQQVTQLSGLHFGTRGGMISLNEIAASWNKETNSLGVAGTWRTGFWFLGHRTLTTSPSNDGSNVFSFTSPQQQNGSAFYMMLEQQLSVVLDRSEALPTRTSKGLASFIMGGFSPEPASAVGGYAEGGLAYTGLLPTRDDDKIGIGFGYSRLGENYVHAGEEKKLPNVGYEAVLEGSYMYQVASAMTIQPDIQEILHPGGSQVHRNALVIGIRAILSF